MQNKITLQQVQLEANQRIIERKHLITVLLTMGLVLLFLLGITLLWSHKQKRKANFMRFAHR
ncbi:MAG: hypothetical protein B7C24_09930 [Bacteroidetes bacterium 4572_77]|nr:MAG: hypothetical protein B7C24_09930 [Bacteroidetes bacterium 4572_77]